MASGAIGQYMAKTWELWMAGSLRCDLHCVKDRVEVAAAPAARSVAWTVDCAAGAAAVRLGWVALHSVHPATSLSSFKD
jgi:hypothetical protein